MVSPLSLSENIPKNKIHFFGLEPFWIDRILCSKRHNLSLFSQSWCFRKLPEKNFGFSENSVKWILLKNKKALVLVLFSKLTWKSRKLCSKIWNFNFWFSMWYGVGKHSEIHHLNIFWCCCQILLGKSSKHCCWILFSKLKSNRFRIISYYVYRLVS